MDSPEIRSRLVGVIDLKNALAVHAVAGHRDSYRPISYRRGDPIALASRYRELGIGEVYLADLDAIAGHDLAIGVVSAICETIAFDRLMVDFGWTGDESQPLIDQLAAISQDHPTLNWIAATESMQSELALNRFAGLTDPSRLLVGLDYRNGQPISRVDTATWGQRAERLGLGGAVILDLAKVGKSDGPTTQSVCRSIRETYPNWTVLSGGGVRDEADVNALLDAGCDRCLVATALHCIL